MILDYNRHSTHRASEVVRRHFPRYRKRSIRVRYANRVTPTGYYWSGGSCSTYWVVKNDRCRRLPVPSGPPPFAPPATEVAVPADGAIVITSIFCGKTGVATVIFPKPLETE